MTVSKSLRFQVFRRDNNTCRYCGAHAPDVKLAVDHVIPETLGGPDTPENLVTACEPCNAGKSATPPDAAVVAEVEESALRWAAAMETARAAIHADRERRNGVRQFFLDCWNGWTYTGKDGKPHTVDLPTGWPTTIDQLTEAGLEQGDIEDAVDIAMRGEMVKDVFKYFCGVSWKLVRKLQETARAVLDGGAGPQDPDTIRYYFVTITCPQCEDSIRVEVEADIADPDERGRVIRCEPTNYSGPDLAHAAYDRPFSRPAVTPADPEHVREVLRKVRGQVDADRLPSPGEAVNSRWAEIVGPDLSAHATPAGVVNGELLILTDSTAWATQVKLLAATLVRRLNEELGEGTITAIKTRRDR
jgi:hypothetical protein